MECSSKLSLAARGQVRMQAPGHCTRARCAALRCAALHSPAHLAVQREEGAGREAEHALCELLHGRPGGREQREGRAGGVDWKEGTSGAWEHRDTVSNSKGVSKPWCGLQWQSLHVAAQPPPCIPGQRFPGPT